MTDQEVIERLREIRYQLQLDEREENEALTRAIEIMEGML